MTHREVSEVISLRGFERLRGLSRADCSKIQRIANDFKSTNIASCQILHFTLQTIKAIMEPAVSPPAYISPRSSSEASSSTSPPSYHTGPLYANYNPDGKRPESIEASVVEEGFARGQQQQRARLRHRSRHRYHRDGSELTEQEQQIYRRLDIICPIIAITMVLSFSAVIIGFAVWRRLHSDNHLEDRTCPRDDS